MLIVPVLSIRVRLLLLALVVPSLSAPAAEYFLGSHASTQPGVAITSIAALNAQILRPGDRVFFEAGETFSGNIYLGPDDSGTASAPVVISSFGTGRATISAGALSAITIYNSSGFDISRLNLVGAGRTSSDGNGIDAGVYLSDNTKLPYLHFSDMAISGFENGVVLWSWYSTATRAWPGFTDVVLSHLDVFANRSDGIKTGGTWMQDGDGTRFSHTNVRVMHCAVWDNRGDPSSPSHTGSGIILSGVDGGVVEYCVAHDNGGQGPTSGGGPFGIWAWEARAVTLQFNLVYNQRTSSSLDGGAYDLDGGCSDCTVQYNYSYNNDGPAIGIIQFQDASPLVNSVVRFNISENDCRKTTQGIVYVGEFSEPYGIKGAEIYSNTFFVSANASGGKPPLVSVQNHDDITNVRFRNNLFYATHSGSLIAGVVTNPAKVLYQGNDYWGGSFDLLAFRSGGQELLNGAPVGLRINPQLRDPGHGGAVTDPTLLPTVDAYALSASSPVASAGIKLSMFGIDQGSQDFFGVPLSIETSSIGASVLTSTPSEQTILVEDNFDGFGRLSGRSPDSASPAGQTWKALTGSATIANGGAVTNTTLRAVIESSAANCTVECPIVLSTGDTGIIVRCSDGSNYLRVVLMNGSIQLKKTEAGVTKTIGSTGASLVIGRTYAVSAKLSDATITLSINGEAIATFTSSFNQQATRHGLVCSNTGARTWERFTVKR